MPCRICRTYTQGGGELLVFALPKPEEATKIESVRDKAMSTRAAFTLVLLLAPQTRAGAGRPSASPSTLPVRPETPDETLARQVQGETPPGPFDANVGVRQSDLAGSGSKFSPGGCRVQPANKNPLARDPRAVLRGMQDFDTFNCSGCRAANAGGGMGPALSTGLFTYGSSPANIFLSIYQGRPNGMPAWGAMLPEQKRSGNSFPTSRASRTIRHAAPRSPERRRVTSIEQVPAEFLQTANPWSFTNVKQRPEAEGRVTIRPSLHLLAIATGAVAHASPVAAAEPPMGYLHAAGRMGATILPLTEGLLAVSIAVVVIITALVVVGAVLRARSGNRSPRCLSSKVPPPHG